MRGFFSSNIWFRKIRCMIFFTKLKSLQSEAENPPIKLILRIYQGIKALKNVLRVDHYFKCPIGIPRNLRNDDTNYESRENVHHAHRRKECVYRFE